jgi:uncharacterized protein YdiU (UPF0061 family)
VTLAIQRIANWNLARLTETLLPLLAEDKDAAVEEGNKALSALATCFETAYASGLRRKLGLFQTCPADLSLAQDLLECMVRNGADFTLTFRRVSDARSALTLTRPCAAYSLIRPPTMIGHTDGDVDLPRTAETLATALRRCVWPALHSSRETISSRRRSQRP